MSSSTWDSTPAAIVTSSQSPAAPTATHSTLIPTQSNTTANNNYSTAPPIGLVGNHLQKSNTPFIPVVPHAQHGPPASANPVAFHHQPPTQHGYLPPPHHLSQPPSYPQQQIPLPGHNNIHGLPPPAGVIQQQQYPLKLPVNSPVSPGSGVQHGPGSNVPVPQTPQGVPAANPFANGPEVDLPPQLLEIGWRKFWSKRENRWYYWNCNTGESLWEMPPFPRPPPQAGQYDPLTDPLGIQGIGHHLANPNLKRRASSGEQLGSPLVKKFILAGPWDLEVFSNVYVSESSANQKHLLPPHPEIEQLRNNLVTKLRQCYQQSCKSREGIDAPSDSLNRWILERKITELKGLDPVFPSCDADSPEGAVSPVMFREIMNDIPMKVVKPRFTPDARKQLAKYADACKRTIETRSTSADARKLVKWKVEETFNWLKTTVGAPYEALQERMTHLRVTCQPHVHDAAKSSVEGICKKMSVLSKQYAQNVNTSHIKLLIEPQKSEIEHEKGRFRCQPALCSSSQFAESHASPQIDFSQPDRDHAILKFRTEPVRISTQYLQKLEQLYRYNCVDDRKYEFFLARSYCLLKRYNAACEDFSHPHGSQSSLPVPVFESIQRNFGVTFECFASPFNCYFRQYCSAFPDIDGYFGSRGTFLGFNPISGSFEMNPPFSEDLIDASITHAEKLLSETPESMSFMIFVPDLSESKDNIDECPWLKRLENSRWNRKQIVIPAYEHEFRHGALHMVAKNDLSIRSTNPTAIFWLQNESGFEEWKPTEQKIDALIEAYKPGRERERDRQDLLSPERQNPQLADKQVAAVAAGCVIPTLPT